MPTQLAIRECIGKILFVFSPVSFGGTDNSIKSHSCTLFTVVPLWSLKHPCTCIYWQEIISVRLAHPEPRLESQHKYVEHSLGPPHSGPYGALRCCSTDVSRSFYLHHDNIFHLLILPRMSLSWKCLSPSPNAGAEIEAQSQILIALEPCDFIPQSFSSLLKKQVPHIPQLNWNPFRELWIVTINFFRYSAEIKCEEVDRLPWECVSTECDGIVFGLW